jgi:hypothetical protein
MDRSSYRYEPLPDEEINGIRTLNQRVYCVRNRFVARRGDRPLDTPMWPLSISVRPSMALVSGVQTVA